MRTRARTYPAIFCHSCLAANTDTANTTTYLSERTSKLSEPLECRQRESLAETGTLE